MEIELRCFEGRALEMVASCSTWRRISSNAATSSAMATRSVHDGDYKKFRLRHEPSTMRRGRIVHSAVSGGDARELRGESAHMGYPTSFDELERWWERCAS